MSDLPHLLLVALPVLLIQLLFALLGLLIPPLLFPPLSSHLLIFLLVSRLPLLSPLPLFDLPLPFLVRPFFVLRPCFQQLSFDLRLNLTPVLFYFSQN